MVTNLDDDLDDFDPAYLPKRVYKDGRGPRVRLMLTDAALPSPPALNRPRFAALDAAELQDGLRAAAAARAKYISELQDAWRGPSNRPPPALKDGQSPRDAYIRRLQTAYKTPPGQADPDEGDADDIEALRQHWLSPGATPGPSAGYRDARPVVSRETKDAVADRDQAYGEYLDRISNAWRR